MSGNLSFRNLLTAILTSSNIGDDQVAKEQPSQVSNDVNACYFGAEILRR